MRKNVLLSIILPIYNVEKYLARCLDTLLAEDLNSVEIILVDDGSTDSSPAICETYVCKSPCIRVLHKKNRGLSSARNAGLDIAEGKYIFWLDSDDWICKGAIQNIMSIIRSEVFDILKFNYYMQPGDKPIKSNLAPGIYTGPTIKNEVVPLALKNLGAFTFSAWSHVYNKKFLEENSLRFVSEREIGSEDYLFNFQTYLAANKIISISDYLYNYEMRMGSLSNCYRVNLGDRYTKLYKYMRLAAERKNENEQLLQVLQQFFVWHCYYIVMVNERRTDYKKTSSVGYKNVEKILNSRELQEALQSIEFNSLTIPRKLAFCAMKVKSAKMVFLLLQLSKKK